MKIKDFFFVIAVFCATVLPATTIVLGGLILFSSCDVPPSKIKTYAIRWESGVNTGKTGTWLTEEELFLGQYQFDPYTGNRFQVISIPAGCKVRATKADTKRSLIITVDRYVSKGDTIMGPDGVYYVPK